MGTSLNGLTPAGTYPGLIKTGDNAPIDGTLKTLSDGNGNNLPMAVSTTTINLTGTAQVGGVAIANTTQLAAKQDTLVSGTNIKTINSTSLLGSGDITISASPSGVSGAIQFSNGSAFASDAANLFWDDTNNRLGIGTNAPSATAHFKGSGSTSATTSLLVQNSGGSTAMQVQDDLSCTLNSGNSGAVKFSLGANSLNINFIANNSGWGLIAGGGVRHYISSAEAARLDQNGAWVVGKGSNADASAITELTSTTKGFLPPRMTTTQRNAIATPASGLVVYDTTTNKLCCYNGSTWNDLF